MILETFRNNWKSYLGIHLAVNMLSLAVLTPLATLMIGWLILFSGQTALKDEDILFFALSPTGSVALLLIAAIFTTIVIFEQAAMILVSHLAIQGEKPGLARIGRRMLPGIWPLFRLSLQMIGRTGLLAIPFLALAALIFNALLTEFDINYYLTVKPPVFWWAGALILMCLLGMAAVLLRVFSGWVLALPLLLLNRASPATALAQSRKSTVSVRLQVMLMLLGLLIFNTAALALVSWLADLAVDSAVFLAGDSLRVLAFLLGAMVVIWFSSNVAITFISNSILSLLVLQLYRRLRGIKARSNMDETVSTPARGRRLSHSVAQFISLLVVFSLIAGLAINSMMGNLKLEDHSQIIAHRGASAQAPENTLAAMELAINQGADWVEIDVQETGDGEVVVIHDSDLKKLGNSNLKVSEASLGALQSVDIGSWMDTAFSDQRIPTLQQLLALCKDRVNIVIELKYYGQEQRLEERVVNIVEHAGMQDQIVVMSLSYAGIRKLKSIRPDWPVGLLSSVAVGDITRLEADFFAVNAKFATRAFIKHAHRKNRKVMVWTVNDPITMSAMMSKGVDGIITDKPALAIEVKKSRSELDLAGRLIIHVASFLGKHPPIPEQ
jgi:glycerophosphoryl diester phosphodiesterase